MLGIRPDPGPGLGLRDRCPAGFRLIVLCGRYPLLMRENPCHVDLVSD